MTSQTSTANAPDQWLIANQQYLDSQLLRLRLLLNRRVQWLRKQWNQDPLQQHQGLIISDAKADSLLDGEDNQAEADFYASDVRGTISRSLAQIDQELSRQLQSLSTTRQAPALEVMGHLFGLSQFERDVLLLCLAPELDPSFAKLYAYVQDDMTRKYPTPHLALHLFAGKDWLAAKRSLMSDGPLRHFRMLTLEPGSSPSESSASHLRLSERAFSYIVGINRIDEGIARFLSPMPSTLLAASANDLIDSLRSHIERASRWPVINIIGPVDSGKGSLARAICDHAGLGLYKLKVSQLPASGPERYEMFRVLEREAALSQFAIYLNAAGIDDASLPNVASSINDVIEQLNCFLIVGSPQRWQAQREMIAVHTPKPDANSQRLLWQQALSGLRHSLNGEIESFVQQFDFGPMAILRAITTAQGSVGLREPGEGAELTADDLWQACCEQAGWHLDELAHRIVPCYTWQDIVLPEDVYRQLQEIGAQVANRSLVYETWGFGAKLNRGRGISALFSGPSGSGKTMAAEVLANDLNLSLYRIDLSGVVSKYIGETEKNLRKVFDAAERSGAILFFDEADALFGKRSEVKDSHDRYANIEVNYLLQRMEEYRGLAILATNMKSHLDQAFMRRLRFLIDFPMPGSINRALIWQKVFPEKAEIDGLDYAALSRLEIPGGNIKNIAVNAAFLAANDKAAIRMNHVLRATRQEFAKIGKLILESEFGPYYAMVKQ